MSLTTVKKRWGSPQQLIIVGLVIALVFTVMGFEVASASIPDNNGKIHGCYKSAAPHALQVIDPTTTPKCPSGTTTLNWNQVNVIEGFHDASQSFSSGTVVGSLSLPAGSYLLTAKVNVFNGVGPGSAVDSCEVVAGTYGDASSNVDIQSHTGVTITLETVATFSSAGTVTVTCTDTLGAGSQSVNDLRLIATEATSVRALAI
jgi:hypothetical protein